MGRILETLGPRATAGADYRGEPLVDLVTNIVEHGAAGALAELIGRRLFAWDAAQRLILPDYLFKLRVELSRHARFRGRAEILEKAYDLTLDKFTRIPPADGTGPSRGPDAGAGCRLDTEPGGEEDVIADREHADCRHYYRAFLDRCRADGAADRPPLEREAAAAVRLQQFVLRHFYFSCAEAARQFNPFTHRYAWSASGKMLSLYMPRAMSGREKREWLATHIPGGLPGRKDGRERVQAIVDSQLCRGRFLPYDARVAYASPEGRGAAPLSWSALHGVSVPGFARAIAEEKAAGIATLRPSIRRLGADRLKSLIADIFDNLHCGGDSDETLARRHGLSKASYSRFAGSDWSASQGKVSALRGREARVPDLWRNMAGLLSRDPVFLEAASAAGVREIVVGIASLPDKGESQGDGT